MPTDTWKTWEDKRKKRSRETLAKGERQRSEKTTGQDEKFKGEGITTGREGEKNGEEGI